MLFLQTVVVWSIPHTHGYFILFESLSFGTFILVTIHGWLTGSDSVTTWMISLYFGCTLAVGALIAARIFISPQPQKGKAPRAIPVPLIAAILIGVLGTIAMFIVHTTLTIG